MALDSVIRGVKESRGEARRWRRGAAFVLISTLSAAVAAPTAAHATSLSPALDTVRSAQSYTARPGEGIGVKGFVAGAATADTIRTPSAFASPFLPPGHWAYGAARRLEALGLAPEGFGGGTRSRTERELAQLFETAELHAELQAPEFAPLVRGYRLRFLDEFPRTAWYVTRGEAVAGWEVLGGRARAGYELHRGRVETGIGYDSETDWTGTLPRPDRRESTSSITAGAVFAPYLALSVTPANRGGRWKLDAAHLVVNRGPFGLWFGRRSLGFHPGMGGGIVLTESRSFDGGGFFLDSPVHLPWIFRHLGPLRLDFLLTRIENGDRIERPWFGALYTTVQPHPRLELGVARGNIFAGDGNTPTTLRHMAQMIFGFHAGEQGEFNNEVFAAHARVRPPVGRLPVVVYLEWGMDDSAGAWRNVPARVLGVELAALPGIPALSVGAERTSFAPACCGNTIWYRNWSLRGGWAASGQPLGHPLAGQGEEWLVYTRADLFQANLNLDLRLFTRERGPENLFAPERTGRSRGGRIALEGRLGGAVNFFLHGALEDGAAGWREEALGVGLQVVF